MSVCIRHHYDRQILLINDSKLVEGNAATGNTIPALSKGGTYLYKPFGGVIDTDYAPPGAQRVKLINITALWWAEDAFGPGYEIPFGDAVLGYFLDDKYYIGIRDDKPVHWPLTITAAPIENCSTAIRTCPYTNSGCFSPVSTKSAIICRCVLSGSLLKRASLSLK